MSLSPPVTFLIILVIGALAGLIFDRVAGPGWLRRQIAGAMPSMLTSALVGVAGAFVGFHLARALRPRRGGRPGGCRGRGGGHSARLARGSLTICRVIGTFLKGLIAKVRRQARTAKPRPRASNDLRQTTRPAVPRGAGGIGRLPALPWRR